MSKELYQKVLEDEELREDLLKLCHKVKIELRDEFYRQSLRHISL